MGDDAVPRPNKHPMQPIALDTHGVARFVRNKIVEHLVDTYAFGRSLNEICRKFDVHGADREDYEQLTMLIGYSVSGFGDLSTSSEDRVALAEDIAASIRKALAPENPDVTT